MEVRCCCTPNKLLGTLPVSKDAIARGTVWFAVTPQVDSWLNTPAYDPVFIDDIVSFEIATWQKLVPGIRLAIDEDDEPDISVGFIVETGLALKHENIDIETLRRIPGFIEEKA
jgi:hypothetical protein